MSVRFMEGFDGQLTAAQLVQKWGSFTSITLLASSGRRSSGCGLFTSLSVAEVGIPGKPTTVIAGMAINPLSPRTNFAHIIEFGSEFGLTQMRVRLNTNNTVEVFRGTSTSLGVSVPTLINDAYSYLEINAFIDPSVGTVEVRLDGDVILTVTPTNTQGATTGVTHVTFSGPSGAGIRVDDIYIADGSGIINKDFLGDTRIDTLIPNADSAIVEFTTDFPATGNHWDKVDDSPVDEDTTYVQTVTSGHRDIYDFTNLPVTPIAAQVLAVMPLAWVKKQQNGETFIRHLVQPVSVIFNQPNQGANAEDWKALHRDIVEINPETSAPRLAAQVDASKFGMEVV